MADTICCLLCRGVVLYTEKDQSRYKTHLTIEHKVFYHIPWLITKTIEETATKPAVINEEVIGTQVDKTLLLGSSVSITPAIPAQGDGRLILGSSVSILPVPVKPSGKDTTGQVGSVSVSLTNVSTGKVVSMNDVGIKEEINQVLNTINSEQLMEESSQPNVDVNEESLEENNDDKSQGIQFYTKKPRRDKTFQCKVCHKYYSERKGLKRHMRRKHVSGVTDANVGENDAEGKTELEEIDDQAQEDMEVETQEEMEGYDSENAINDPLQSEVRDLVRNIISGEDVGENVSGDSPEEEVEVREDVDGKDLDPLEDGTEDKPLEDGTEDKPLEDGTEDKPHKCEVCQLSYTAKKGLKDHMRRKHGDFALYEEQKPFQCNICSKGFKTKWYMATHEKSHTSA